MKTDKTPDQPGYKYARADKEPTREDVIKYLRTQKPMKINHFTIKEDGELYVLQDMPKGFDVPDHPIMHEAYKSALQSAINNAVKVENQDDVFEALWRVDPDIHNPISLYNWRHVILPKKKKDIIYPLECEVEIKEIDTVEDGGGCFVAGSKTVAHITFSKPKEESAEDYFKERFDSVYWDDKFDRKSQRFDFYDMVDFANQYAAKFKPIPPLPVEDKEEQDKLWNGIEEVHKASQWFSGDALNYIKRNYNLTRKQLE